MEKELVVVIDFGGQYNQLVARRVRECNVYCEIYSYKTDLNKIKAMNPKGIILTGGPASCYESGAATCSEDLFHLGVPVLGLCYGAQLMTHVLGGKVERAAVREYGKTEVKVDRSSKLFSDVSENTICWMSHFDYISKLAPGFRAVATTANCPVAAAECVERGLYAIQFHPEVLHTVEGSKMLYNFVRNICGCCGDWKMDSFVEESIKAIREKVGNGTYSLSAFSTVFHALYRAGGVNKIGSLRGIKLVRNGKTIENLDVYEFIMKGKMNDDIRLQEGDVIIVNPYESLVEIVGKVKRPMYYEMKPTETVANLLEYAGGFTGDSYKKAIRLIRKSGREHQVFNVDEMDYSVFRLDDGDLVTVDAVLDRFENKVEISGAVYRSGLYQLDGEVNTVKQLIKKAEGLRGDAFLNRVLLDREHEDLSHEVIAIDLNGLLNGTVADIPLQKDDHLYIPSVNDLKEEETVSIYGEVLNPGTFLYSDKMTIEDLVVQAGGLREAAATTRVSVTRRIKDPKSTAYSSKLAETFAFDIKDGLVIGDADFYLQPFDMVQIRRSPAYKVQRTVSVSGEVLFSGSYALLKKNERLSDLIKRAGGITPDAYIKGGRLIRRMNDEERRRERDALRMARNGEGKDSISVAKLAITETYTVGIDMEKALANPGSDYDVVLREGDVIYIPEFVNTVKISGSVMYPNTVAWEKGAKLKHYINMAGGYGNMAKKKKAYIIYLNGTVARAKRGDSQLIQPGCEIVVPSKAEKQHMKFAEILGISSTTATMAAMVATLVNAFK